MPPSDLADRLAGAHHGLSRAVRVSFEFFPPTDEPAAQTLWSAVQRLAPLAPRFVSITYGAGGSTRDRTHQLVRRLLGDTSLTPAPHLTCVGSERAQIEQIARSYWDAGVRHIVALRGDPVPGSGAYCPRPDGFPFAVDLVRGLRAVADFEISVAAYPEVHPEARDAQADLDNLKAKLDAGADRAITQFFFDPALFLRFRERCAAAGIRAPLVPGILPITRFPQMLRFAERAGASVPAWLRRRFDGLEDDTDTRRLIAAAFAISQVETLCREGVEEFHFYTLNRAELTYAICHALGLRPGTATAPAVPGALSSQR